MSKPMLRDSPPFRADHVGSLLRPSALLAAREKRTAGSIDEAELRAAEDDAIRDLMNRHQRASDKGFGRAAGPDAVDCAERSFAAAGYQVRREASDWMLLPEQRALQRQLIEGWAHWPSVAGPAALQRSSR